MKSRKIELFICLSCSAVVVGFIFFSSDPATLMKWVSSLRFGWIIAAVLSMVFFWMFETLALHFLLRHFFRDQSFRDSMFVSMGGQYFSAITPFSTGGQPFQAYYLSKKGRDVGVVAGALLMKFIIYQIALVTVSTVLLILRWNFFRELIPNFYWVVLIGYVINAGVLVFLIIAGQFRGIADGLCRFVIKIGTKLRIVKDKEKALLRAEETLGRFHSAFQGMKKEAGLMVVCLFFCILQLISYFSVSYFVYRSFGLSSTGFVTILGAQGFVMMISSFVPIPGAGVGAESSYYLLFKGFYPEAGQVNVAIIIWRLISFYLTVIVGAVFALRIGKVKSESRKNNITEGEGQ